ncbi:MAG: murein biosynthesis integral membrane protein MurJ [Spirochaetaceae bacterium]|jgi:putative peptidoglycan lipid II flippase|nr:murein biosynthesis integral membrane protein MurJ [Spirochaetaceae bacterium]
MLPIAENPQNNISFKTMAHSLLRQGSILSLLTLISRILGLLREMTKAALLGTSVLSDAFSVAFMIPNLFRRLFAEGSVAVAFIPTFKEYLQEDKPAQLKEFLSCTLTMLTCLVTCVVVLGVLVTPAIIAIFGIEAFDETVLLTRLMFPFLAFISIAALFQGILNSVHCFAPSGFAPIVLNIVTIACAYGLSRFVANPARALAAGILIGGFLEGAIQLPFVLKKGFRFFFTSLRTAIRNPGVQRIFRLIVPTIIGMAAYQLNDLVSTVLAGNVGAGTVSSLQYSLRLQELILGVFAVSLGTVLLPHLTDYAQSGRWEHYSDQLGSCVKSIALLTIPITFFTLGSGESLVRLLFQGRSFDESSVALTVAAFQWHMPGLFFIALNRILAPAFYAQSNSASPTKAGIVSFLVNIVLAAALAVPFKGAGIAAALSIASAVNTVLLFIFLKKNSQIAVKQIVSGVCTYSLKLIVFSALAVMPALYLNTLLLPIFDGHNRIISLGIPLALAGIVYALLGLGLLFVTGDKHIRALIREKR